MASNDDTAECVVRKFVRSASVKLTCDDELIETLCGDSLEKCLLRCSLFGLSPRCKVSYDEVFCRVVYEAARLGGTKLLKQFVCHGQLKLESTFGLTAVAAADILNQFSQEQNMQNRQFYWFRGAAMLCLKVLVNHSIGSLGLGLTSKIDFGFVEEICDLSRDRKKVLPSFSELKSRFNTVIDKCKDTDNGLPLRGAMLDRQRAELWKMDASIDPHDDPAPLRPIMDTNDFNKAIQEGDLRGRMEAHLNTAPVDVQLGYTDYIPSDPSNISNDTDPTSIQPAVSVEEKVATFREKEGHLLGVFGELLSEEFCQQYINHIENDLTFFKAPTGNRMSRVASIDSPQSFIIGSHVCEATKATRLEERILEIGRYIQDPLVQVLEEYGSKNGKRLNPHHVPYLNIAHTSGGLNRDAQYDDHSDADVLNSENAEDLTVLTIVFSNTREEDGVSLDVYYPNASQSSNLVASMPSYGCVSSHFQLVELNKHCTHKPNVTKQELPKDYFRYVITLRGTRLYQENEAMILDRLQRRNYQLNGPNFISKDMHKFGLDGIEKDTGSSLRPFPDQFKRRSRASNLHGSRIVLSNDRFKDHPMAQKGQPIAVLVQSKYFLSNDTLTWVLLTAFPCMQHVILKGHHVIVKHQTQAKSKKKGELKRIKTTCIKFGPLLDESTFDWNKGKFVPVFPVSVIFDPAQVAAKLDFVHKDQIHQYIKTDPKENNTVFLRKMYRCGYKQFVAFLVWWKRQFDKYVERKGVLDPQDPDLDSFGPTFWFGTGGGGATQAGERCCPEFGSAKASREAPDAYVGGARKDTPENIALDYLFYSNRAFQLFGTVDPKNKHLQESGVLPRNPGTEEVAAYGGILQVVKLEPSVGDKTEAILEDSLLLQLDADESRFMRYRQHRHGKLHVQSILTPRHYYEVHGGESSTPLVVSGAEFGGIGVWRPAYKPPEPSNSVLERIPLNTYLSLQSESRDVVSSEELLQSFKELEQYKKYRVGEKSTEQDDQELVELSPGLTLSKDDVLVTMCHLAVANFARMRRLNLHDDEESDEKLAGYLTGPSFSSLSCVLRMHGLHSPVSRYDRITMFYVASVENTLQKSHNMSRQQATTAIKGCSTNSGDLLKIILYTSTLVRMFGRTGRIGEWCKHHVGATSENRKAPFLPSTIFEVESFCKFMLRSCIEPNDQMGTTAPFRAKGDSSTIPSELLNPIMAVEFLKKTFTNMDKPTSVFTQMFHDAKDKDRLCCRDSFCKTYSNYLSDCLQQKDKNDGCDFKTNQIVRDFELLFPGKLLKFGKITSGFGSKRAFKTWSFDACTTEDEKCLAMDEYANSHGTEDQLAVIGYDRTDTGDLTDCDGSIVNFGTWEHGACGIYGVRVQLMANRRSNISAASQPYHLPTEEDWLDAEVAYKNTAVRSLQTYEKMVKEGTWKEIPEQLRYLNEDEVRKALDDMKASFDDGNFETLFAGEAVPGESSGLPRKRKRYDDVPSVPV